MVKREIVTQKVENIKASLKKIRLFSDFTLEQFLEDGIAQDVVVFNLFLIVQNLIDIGNHVISDNSLGEPSSYSDIPIILKRAKILNENEMQIFRSMIQFRNIIAHEYAKIDLHIVYDIFKNKLADIELIVSKFIEYCGI
ncbi:type VII toxin-antitoxin system HepT family RNase toxin [Caldicellulosiruptor sp. DIB 104C]|uniref:type VII toxin-antitoxin system HepT family RNase toxin n=1 Tax=Caldicellulosiruptor sp. DIB 104C TaxID=3019889 RepID=UPI002305838E|nr:DUF86 domain-containing protein [Caldicellulosiruptor sp. DIB 104C]